ncbi:claudin-4-like isoform X1 [Poecilia latipinna]|uniref:claudin-4-like isoform X1 n=1 Tax=Poecilia latipinna TaxID=48699 RepID=UPI00072D946B|nr:PREDICTED: claudin-4-like isoform X1 [Poecilia latipinna]
MLFQTVSTLFKDTTDRRTCRTRERMASKTVQTVCVVLSAIGLFGVIICCALPEWFVIHRGDTEVHVGLWKACGKHSTGPQECLPYDDSRLPSEVKAFRALTIISCILCGLSLLLLIFGSDFTPCVQNENTKPKMILAAGVGLLLTGLLVIIPVSWVTHDMRNAPQGVMLGASIYIGFVAGLMLMLTGGLLCYLSRSSSSGGTASFFSNRV